MHESDDQSRRPQPLATAIWDVQHALNISQTAITAANDQWLARKRTILEGLGEGKSEDSFKQLQQRYTNISRYCSEANKLITFHSTAVQEHNDAGREHDDTEQEHNDAENMPHEVFALDPHILIAYSEPWNHKAHFGFGFFDRELIPENPDAATLRFPVFVYTSLFRQNPMILDTGRNELSDTIAHFDNELNEPRSEIERVQRNAALTTEIKALVEKANEPGGKITLPEAFKDLMLLGGAPQLRQQMAMARLLEAMRSNNFLTPESSIRLALKNTKTSDAKIARFSTLLRHIRDNPATLANARRGIFDAYARFLVSNSYDENKYNELRAGEVYDVNALLEVHVINTCLGIAEVPVQVNYVTLSARLHEFVRCFPYGDLRTPLLHPRTAIMMRHRNIFERAHEEMKEILSSAIASDFELQRDRKVTVTELDEFEKGHEKPLTAIRDVLSHVTIDDVEERHKIIDTLRSIFNDDSSSADRGLLEYVERILGERSQKVVAAFNEDGSNLSDQAWKTYESFVKQAGEAQEPIMIVRKYVSQKGADKKVERLSCLPVRGSLRYLFMVHNNSVIETIEEKILKESIQNFKAITFRELLEAGAGDHAIKSGSNTSEILEYEQASLSYFIRAVYAASAGQWQMAETWTEKAQKILLKLPKPRPKDPSTVHSLFWRARLLEQEVLFLCHLCRRGIANTFGSGMRKSSWLKRAAEALKQSAQRTMEIPPEEVPFRTGINPISVRQTLAAIGLSIEWMADRSSTSPIQPLEPLPESDDESLCWNNMPFFKRKRSDNPVDDLIASTKMLFERIKKTVADIDNNSAEGHSGEVWNYFLVRADSLLLLIDTCIDVGLLDPKATLVDNDLLNTIFIRHQKNQAWIQEATRERRSQPVVHDITGIDVRADQNPFFRSLISAANMRNNAIFDEDEEIWKVANVSELYGSFAQLDANCNQLALSGFPRRLMRMVKKAYAPAIAEQISTDYPPK